MTTVRIIRTEDGSDSLFNEQLNETYHSIHGAIQESDHVFIKHGLECVLANNREIRILEVGFGTGLNVLLTLRQTSGKSYAVWYTGLEPFPVADSIWTNLNYGDMPAEKEWFQKLHRTQWSQWSEITPTFKFQKIQNTLQRVELDKDSYNLIYFDAFAPNKQAEMWELSMLKKVVEAMTDQSVFVTYCASGQLKRNLRTLGLEVESLPGSLGKREMVRAVKN